jgi:hypothetical protein
MAILREGKADIAKANLIELFIDSKTSNIIKSSLGYLLFHLINTCIVTIILEENANPALMPYSSKILFPFHSFL